MRRIVSDTRDCPLCGEPFDPGSPVAVTDGGVPADDEDLSCPECEGPVAADDNFCRHCGADVAYLTPGGELTNCPSCDVEIEPEDSFCRSCGEDLDAHRPAGGASDGTDDAGTAGQSADDATDAADPSPAPVAGGTDGDEPDETGEQPTDDPKDDSPGEATPESGDGSPDDAGQTGPPGGQSANTGSPTGPPGGQSERAAGRTEPAGGQTADDDSPDEADDRQPVPGDRSGGADESVDPAGGQTPGGRAEEAGDRTREAETRMHQPSEEGEPGESEPPAGQGAEAEPVADERTDGEAEAETESTDDEAPDGDAVEADAGAESEEVVVRVRGHEIAVPEGETLGRKVRSALIDGGVEEDEAVHVHREHVRFEREDGQFHLVDLGRNSTVVNGEFLEQGDRVPVTTGDRIELSKVAEIHVVEA